MYTAETGSNITFSGGTLFALFFQGLFNIAVPVALMIFWRRRTRASLFPVLIGFLTYQIVAFIRAGFRAVIFTDELRQTAWQFYLVSALLSGVLEESGRYVSMRYIMYEKYDDWRDAVSYGIGHGACELILGTALTAFGWFFQGRDCNSRGAAALIKADTLEKSEKLLDQLEAHAGTGAWEVIGSMSGTLLGAAFHIAMSVLVFSAVHYIARKRNLFIAIGLHTFANFAVYAISVIPALAILCVVPDPGIFVDVPILIYVWLVYKKLNKED